MDDKEPEGLIPPGYSVTLTMVTMDDDHVGPTPNITTRPVYWEFRHSEIGVLVVACAWNLDGGAWEITAHWGSYEFDGPIDAITQYFVTAGDPRDNGESHHRAMTLTYLHENGLV